MKSRIQQAGVAHGSTDGTLWKGDLPMISGFPGMRFVLHTGTDKPGEAYQFKQVCIEINTESSEYEQVIYVMNVDRTKKELLG